MIRGSEEKEAIDLSEPKLISPLLDGYVMGDPMSEHDGVRCCPAMKKDSDEKYIVKILSIPANQTKVEALLLTGAFPNSAAALDYFRGLGQDIVNETEELEKLSKLEGFLPFDGVQMLPMDGEVGYDVYLLSPYRRSLERYFRKEVITHLAAVNLGLDLCAAAAIARHEGFVCIDLKPENVFISEKQEYRIGDLGLARMEDLSMLSLPEKYLSAYTAPEVRDPMATLNPSVDVYAIGKILAQAFNGGTLPEETDGAIVAPAYADYEMAEIIQKACAAEPKDRWENPAKMGQAIVSYMQRNGANDVPIVPQSVREPEEKTAFPDQEPDTEPTEDTQECPEEPVDNEEEISDEEPDEPDEEDDQLSFLSQLVGDETAPGTETVEEVDYASLSGETSEILSVADDLIAAQVPEPVVAPGPVDVPIPEPITPEQPEEPGKSEENSDEAPAEDAVEAEEVFEAPMPKKERKPFPVKKVVGAICGVAVAAAVFVGGYSFYHHYYLVNVNSLSLSGSKGNLTIQVESPADEKLLSVTCKDTHGNVLTSPVVNGRASFTGLPANTQFDISLSVEGFHKLTGSTSRSYNTPAQTNIVQFNAVAGTEDGAAILSFTVDGKEPNTWTIAYSAEGEEEKTVSFSGHMITIRELTVGKTYTFRIVETDDLYLTGTDSVEFTAAKMVYAENLAVTGYQTDSFTISWKAPEEAQVNSWTVRCYNDAGFEQTQTVTEPTATITGVDYSQQHTVEVTAEGMSIGSHLYVSANPVTITDISADTSDPSTMVLSWSFEGLEPEGGWLVMYGVDDCEQQIVTTKGTSVVVENPVPNATYHVTVQTSEGVSVIGGAADIQTPEAQPYSAYYVADTTGYRISTFRTPGVGAWSYWNISDSDFTDTFAAGQTAGFSMRFLGGYSYDGNYVTTMLVIRDSNGRVVKSSVEPLPFNEVCVDGRYNADIPSMPTVPGTYTLEVYIDGGYLTSTEFTVTAQ